MSPTKKSCISPAERAQSAPARPGPAPSASCSPRGPASVPLRGRARCGAGGTYASEEARAPGDLRETEAGAERCRRGAHGDRERPPPPPTNAARPPASRPAPLSPFSSSRSSCRRAATAAPGLPRALQDSCSGPGPLCGKRSGERSRAVPPPSPDGAAVPGSAARSPAGRRGRTAAPGRARRAARGSASSYGDCGAGGGGGSASVPDPEQNLGGEQRAAFGSKSPLKVRAGGSHPAAGGARTATRVGGGGGHGEILGGRVMGDVLLEMCYGALVIGDVLWGGQLFPGMCYGDVLQEWCCGDAGGDVVLLQSWETLTTSQCP